MHRQADHLRGEPLAHRNAAIGDREMPIGFLPVERDRIVDGGRDALRLEGGREGIAPAGAQADGVLSPYLGRAARKLRHRREVRQMLGIALRDTVAH